MEDAQPLSEERAAAGVKESQLGPDTGENRGHMAHQHIVTVLGMIDTSMLVHVPCLLYGFTLCERMGQ